MPSDVFTVIADPTRRAILDALRAGPASVSELVATVGLPQPTVSKHLRVLRENAIVSCEVAAQSRIYRLDPAPLAELDGWLRPYRRLWQRSFRALGEHLDRTRQQSQRPDDRRNRR